MIKVVSRMQVQSSNYSMIVVVVALPLLLTLVATPLPVHGRSGGAPEAACSTLTPQHPSSPQTSAIPYTIDLSVFDDRGGNLSYYPGMSYQCEENNVSGCSIVCMLQVWYLTACLCFAVTLSDGGGMQFRGFLIQARLMSDDTTVVGSFSSPPAGARLSSCTPPEVYL